MKDPIIFKPDVVLSNKKRNEEILPLSQNKRGIFCQHYLYFSEFKCPTDSGKDTFYEMHDFVTRKFTLPEGMSFEDAFKVISFLTNHVEKEYGLKECSAKTVQYVDNLIEKFHFSHIEPKGETPFRFLSSNCEPCTHLFTVNGDVECFDHSQYATHYFEWFSDNVKFEDVKEIYKNLGLHISKPSTKQKSERTV